jgi:uncharacterized membrane protein YedE/YeeE
LWGMLISVLILLLSLRLRRKSVRNHLFDLVLVAGTGIFGLCAVHMIPSPEE